MRVKKITEFGKWAIITGASSGIGKAFAYHLAKQNVNLVLVGRRVELLDVISEQLETSFNIKTKVLILDLTQTNIIEEIDQCTKSLNIGLLISNAGAGAMGAFVRNERETFKSMLQLNVIAQMELTHYFSDRFLHRNLPSGVLLVSSMAALQAVPYSGNYSGAKSYILRMGEALHHELEDKNIHVSVLIPGPTDTPGLNARNDIDLSKFPGKVMSAEDVVNEGLNALVNNKATHLAGIHNRIMKKIMPNSLLTKMMGSLMKKHAPKELSI